MLTKILYTVPLVCFALVTAVFAQSIEKKYFVTRQECQDARTVMEKLVNKYNESALFTGQTIQFDPNGTPYTGGGMFLVNQDTGTWTLITLYADGSACVTAVGNEFEPYVGDERR